MEIVRLHLDEHRIGHQKEQEDRIIAIRRDKNISVFQQIDDS